MSRPNPVMNGQRYNHRQPYQGPPQPSNPNMYSMAPSYVMPGVAPAPDDIHCLINHKFFQGNRAPLPANACGYQSINQPFNQYSPPVPQYAAYPYTQPPAAVQQ